MTRFSFLLCALLLVLSGQHNHVAAFQAKSRRSDNPPTATASRPAFQMNQPETNTAPAPQATGYFAFAPAMQAKDGGIYYEEEEEEVEISFGTAIVACAISLALGFGLGYGT